MNFYYLQSPVPDTKDIVMNDKTQELRYDRANINCGKQKINKYIFKLRSKCDHYSEEHRIK
jgi:hypothetical protein